MSETDMARSQIAGAVQQNSALSRTGIQERAFARMFQGLVYAQIWEDPVVDLAGLALQPGERVVCIASGGCNLMSYLTAAPGAVDAVDLSPAHVALNRLKIAAATAPFFGLLALMVVLLALFPDLALFLPRTMFSGG